MKSGQQPSGKTDWGTPPNIMSALESEFGVFDLDPCATYDNKKAQYYFGPGSFRCGSGGTYCYGEDSHPCELCRPAEDGLAETWDVECEGRTSVFVNPPYGRGIGKWVEKCYEEVRDGNAELVVALLPVATDTRWWQWVSQATEVRFLKGRVQFEGADGPAPFASAIVIWRRGQLGWHRVSYWDSWKDAPTS